MIFQDIDFQKAWSMKAPIFVDVRSESEYAEDHIPGAVNIPLFNDEERELIGTIYKQQSPGLARTEALRILSPKLPALVAEIEELSEQGSVVIYCWRGGERSQAIASVLCLMKIFVYRLQGGYKAYRQQINEYWHQEFAYPVVVLHGLTGVGKTRILNALADRAQVIDLEGLAGNRGSVFGNVGLPPQPSQKQFESRIWHELSRMSKQKPVIVECESRRIGRVTVPPTMFNAMKSAKRVLAYDTVGNRVVRIIEDYRPAERKAEIIGAIELLAERLGSQKVTEFTDLVQREDFEPVVEELLVKYYDPLYKYPSEPGSEYNLSVSAADTEAAAVMIAEYMNKLIQD